MRKIAYFTCAALLAIAGTTHAQSTISTSFDNATFATGATTPVTLMSADGALSATFSGGQQLQSFDGPSYSAGPDAYFFINSGASTFTGSFGGSASGNNDTGSVQFNTGVDNLSFFAADRANGTPNFELFDVSGGSLGVTTINSTVNNDGFAYSFDSAVLGSQIGSITFDNAGPAGNPPYVIAIDSFSASVSAIPEPSSIVLGMLTLGGLTLRRRR